MACCSRVLIASGPLQKETMCAAVWAGLEFKVGSAAISSLPPFRRGKHSTGPSAMEALKAAAQQQQQQGQQQTGAEHIHVPGRLHAFTPAQLPPSRAETDEWLAQERRMEGSQGSNSSRSKPRTPGGALMAFGRSSARARQHM